MILFIIGLLILIVGLLAAVVGRRESAGWVVGGVFAALVGLAAVVWSCTAYIKAAEVGVPVTLGKLGAAMQPGLHVVAPWTRVETFPTRPVNVELSGESEVTARTRDAGGMRVGVATRWKVEPEMAPELYLQVRTGDDAKISDTIVTPNLRQAVGLVYSQTGNLDANSDRAGVTAAIQKSLVDQLKRYGITVEDVNIRYVNPDDAVNDSIARFAAQQQATRIAEEGVKTSAAEAERQRVVAEGQKAAASQLRDISDAQANLLCVQTWERVMTESTKAGVPVYGNPCSGSSGVGGVIVGGR